MSCVRESSGRPHLIWVYNAPAAVTLAATSRLEVTNELRKMGWRVTLVAEGSAGWRDVRGVEVLCIPKPSVYLLGHCLFHLRLFGLLAGERATTDVVLFSQMSAPWLLSLRLVRRLIGRTQPLLVMDTRDVHAASSLKNRLRVLYHNFGHQLSNRWADGQTAITQRMADWKQIPSRHLWGIWPSGADVDSFVPARAARRWPSDGEPIRLIYVGVLLRERNLAALCRAVERSHGAGMAFTLTLVGDGPEQVHLQEFALRTEGRVRLLPPVAHDQVSGLLAQAHVGVTSLAFAEQKEFQVCSPIKLFEYMAAGLPILVTRNVCYTDVVGKGEFAFWAQDPSVEELAAALRLIWHARASLRRMGSEAATAAQAWTWRESARKLSNALEHGITACHDRCAGS